MPHPFQCLFYCPNAGGGSSQILLAASGSHIHTFDVSKGVLLSTWSSCVESEGSSDNKVEPQSGTTASVAGEERGSQPPRKRQRLTPSNEDVDSSSAEIVVDSKISRGRAASNPPIVKVSITGNGQYIVAVTGEDKCIRVLELSANGLLRQYSER